MSDIKQSKFLTVMAILDDETQIVLKELQNKLSQRGFCGVQSADVPFHISLGSFPTVRKEEVIRDMERAAENFGRFTVRFSAYSNFGGRVLYLKPDANQNIDLLHGIFDCNFADGLEYCAHTTLYIGDDALLARKSLGELALPVAATVTGLLLGEFFPTNLIAERKFKN